LRLGFERLAFAATLFRASRSAVHPAGHMELWPMDRRVGNVRNDGVALVHPMRLARLNNPEQLAPPLRAVL
jgi:hypothetical protein